MICELPDFWSETWRTCRGRSKKPMRCVECDGEIVKGMRYLDYSGKWEGDVQTYRFHELCWQIHEGQHAFIREHTTYSADEYPAFGEMVEYAREDADNMGGFPDYWPPGLYVGVRALRAHVSEQWSKQNDGSTAAGGL